MTEAFQTKCPHCGTVQEPNSEYGDLDGCDNCGDQYKQYFNMANPKQPDFTVCEDCGSAWTTGESINWQRNTCGFCGSADLEYNRDAQQLP